MSGGAFEYKQFHIKEIAGDIQSTIQKMGKKKLPHEQLYNSPEHFEKYPEDEHHIVYPPEVVMVMTDAIQMLKSAHIYTQNIDKFISGDIGEDDLIKNIQADLEDMGPYHEEL